MQLNSLNTMMPRLQTNGFNPIQNYNQYLKGSASFDVNTDFQNDFDKLLEKQVATDSATSRKLNNLSPVDNLMNSIETAFGNGLNDVNEKKLYANSLHEALARGEDVSAHDMMIAAEKSSLSLQMAMQIRNKMISAYTDIKNMSF